MSNNIKLHKNDLPDDLDLGNLIAVDGEFMGLNVRRDPLCLIQISSGNSDAHIIQFDRKNYDCLLYTSPSPRDATLSRMPSSA